MSERYYDEKAVEFLHIHKGNPAVLELWYDIDVNEGIRSHFDTHMTPVYFKRYKQTKILAQSPYKDYGDLFVIDGGFGLVPITEWHLNLLNRVAGRKGDQLLWP